MNYAPGGVSSCSANTPCFVSLTPKGATLLKKRLNIQMADVDTHAAPPEKLLVLAMMERALADICSPTLTGYDKRDAEAWLFSTDRSQYSALWWTELIDGEHILKQIKELARKKSYRRAHGWIKREDYTGNRSG